MILLIDCITKIKCYYSNIKLADMYYVYGLADGNGEQVRGIYQKRYPNRVFPDSGTFLIFIVVLVLPKKEHLENYLEV